MTLKPLAALFAMSLPCHGFELSPGAPFPEIPLPTTDDGELASIADFRGKKLILHVFASW